MGHARQSHTGVRSLDLATARVVATTLQALATPSRLFILATLRDGPQAVGDLADAVGMEGSAVSHQLRLLRNLGLVSSERRGRHVIYALHDDHVAELLDQALFHAEHLRLGATTAPFERSPGQVEGDPRASNVADGVVLAERPAARS